MASPLRYLDDPALAERERQVFVAVALDQLARADTVDLQVSKVVAAAGRHNAAFYRLFGSKDGFIVAVVAEAARRTVEVVERHLAESAASNGTPRNAVRVWATTLLSMAAGGTAHGVLALALDRHRLLHQFPESQSVLTAPLCQPLARVLREAHAATAGPVSGAAAVAPGDAFGGVSADALAEAAFELVMSRQATWIALGHQPDAEELAFYVELVLRLTGIPDFPATQSPAAQAAQSPAARAAQRPAAQSPAAQSPSAPRPGAPRPGTPKAG